MRFTRLFFNGAWLFFLIILASGCSSDGTAPTEFGKTAKFEKWKLKVLNVKQEDQIKFTLGTFRINKDVFSMYLVEVELENTISTNNIIEIDPRQMKVLDSNGQIHESIGTAAADAPFALDNTKGSHTINSTQEGPSGTFTVDTTDQINKKWKLELTGKGSTKMTFAFAVPKNTQVKELHWPNMAPFKLDKLKH